MTCQELAGFFKSCQELPGIARSCQNLPLPGIARSWQELLANFSFVSLFGVSRWGNEKN